MTELGETPPHELLAGDPYWYWSPAPRPKLSLGTWQRDGRDLGKPWVADAVNAFFQGDTATKWRIADGETLPVPQDKLTIIRIVQDQRLGPSQARLVGKLSVNTPEEFDRQATEIMRDTLYRGPSPCLRLDDPNGPVGIARMVFYCLGAPSGRQLFGILGEDVGKRTPPTTVPLLEVNRNYTHRDGLLKVARAEILTPKDHPPQLGRPMEYPSLLRRILDRVPTPNPNPAPNVIPEA